MKNLWSWVTEITSGYGNSCSNAEGGPSRDQIPHQLGEYAAPIDSEMAFAGRMANAEAGPSLGQNPPPLMDFGGRMANAEATPNDLNAMPPHITSHPIRPPKTHPIRPRKTGPPFNTEAGPTDSEEDESYCDFRDGFNNPVAVQRLAKMVDTMTDLNVARKIAENGRYEAISDLINDLNTGEALGIKAEDVEKTRRVLKKLVSTISKQDMKALKVRATSFLLVNI
jgi:hypothetical protein